MGKKSGPAAPPPPDPQKVADAQGQMNKETAITQANLNRIDQITPQGSITYNNKGNMTWEDGTPRYQQVVTYSPEQQALYEQQVKISRALGGTAENSINRVNSAMDRDFNFDGMQPMQTVSGGSAPRLQIDLNRGNFNETSRAASDAVFGQLASRLDPQFSQLENDMRTRLINSGISENSEAFRREMDNFARGRTDAYNTASNQSILTGLAAQDQGFSQDLAAATFGNTARGQQENMDRTREVQGAAFNNDVRQRQIEEATYLRNLPLNDIAALLGTGGGVQAPTFSPVSQVGVNPADYQGAVYNSYNAQMQQWQQAQQNRSQGLGSIFGLAGTLAPLAFSDKRLKHNIKQIGKLVNGIATYVFSYIGDTMRHFGVMAQEVADILPEAVGVHNGAYYVDYRKVGLA